MKKKEILIRLHEAATELAKLQRCCGMEYKVFGYKKRKDYDNEIRMNLFNIIKEKIIPLLNEIYKDLKDENIEFEPIILESYYIDENGKLHN